MKALGVSLILFLSVGCNADTKKSTKTLPINEAEKTVKKEQVKVNLPAAIENKEEDCDEKAKKPIEIKETSISLTGNTGCSLDEIK